jgi:hypothetical protein
VSIVAVGDLACQTGAPPTSISCQQMATSNLALSANPDAVIELGDAQYDCGSASDFAGSYDPSWGRLKAITHPVIGNHEYNIAGGTTVACPGLPAPDATAYFNYFGTAADPAYPGCMPNCNGYYSFDLGSWHIVMINAMLCGPVLGGKCYLGSAQEKWLVADLKAHSNQCTLAAWHEPLYSTSEKELGVQQLWADLYAYGADVVLNGHLHRYERWAPQDQNGNRDDAYGLREFVIGTGGRSFQSLGSGITANFEVGDATSFGVMKMTLHTNGYDWQFLPTAGGSFTDSGSASCHGKPGSFAIGSDGPAARPSRIVARIFDAGFGGSATFAGGMVLFGVGRSRRRGMKPKKQLGRAPLGSNRLIKRLSIRPRDRSPSG